MRRHFLILILLIGAGFMAKAQDEFDVTKHYADTKAFTFDDGKSTVRGYLSSQLMEKTTCCGKDRIYLEIKIDPSGNVLHAKAITGTNECIKRSAEDIVKNIKWDAADFRGPTSKYLEIRPDIECADDRNNSYTKIEVFNNDLLNPEGTPAKEGTAPVATKEEVKEATTPVVKAEPVKTEPKPVMKEEVKETKEEVVLTPKEDKMEETNSEDVAANTEEDSSSEEEALEEEKDATRKAQEEEVVALREQLAEMRRKEIAKRRKQAAKQRYIERKRREKQEREAADGFAKSSNLYEDDPYADTGGEGFGAGDGEVPKDEAIEDEIARLKEQISELNAANDEREAAVKASIEEAQTTNQEILRIEEEIVAKEEEKERYREEQELAQIEKEKAEAEEARRSEEEAYQRMMEEIKRLQEEADAKIAELEAKKKEVDRMAKVKTMREQEIALERSLRDKEAQARLAEARMRLQSQGNAIVSIGDDVSSNTDELMAMIPDLTAEVDSEKLAILIQTINVMRTEIERLREQIASMEGTPVNNGGTTKGSIAGTTRSTDPKKSSKGGIKNAADDTSWKNFVYKQPGLEDSEIYTSVKNEQPPVDGSNQQGTPAINNSGEDQKTGNHENSQGPKFQAREYVGGKSAMKDLIKSKLKDGGVCGLAQSVFSVTLNSSGRVIRSTILAANTPQVKVQLDPILKSLKFNQVETRIPQTIYLEFKAEILCEGSQKVNLQEVQDIIKK